jgi:hypothetical protein
MYIFKVFSASRIRQEHILVQLRLESTKTKHSMQLSGCTYSCCHYSVTRTNVGHELAALVISPVDHACMSSANLLLDPEHHVTLTLPVRTPASHPPSPHTPFVAFRRIHGDLRLPSMNPRKHACTKPHLIILS